MGLSNFPVVTRKVRKHPSISLENKLVEMLIWDFRVLCWVVFWNTQLDNIQGSVSQSSFISSSSSAALIRAASPTVHFSGEHQCLTIPWEEVWRLATMDHLCRSALTSHGHPKWLTISASWHYYSYLLFSVWNKAFTSVLPHLLTVLLQNTAGFL